MTRLNSDLEKSLPPTLLRNRLQNSTPTSLTTASVSLCAIGENSFHPLCSPSASGSAALGLPAPWLQYSVYPSPASDIRPLGLAEYHLKHNASPAELSYLKFKTPLINRNYLELAMLVCNTFRGKLFPCPHCRYVTDRRNNLKRHISTMHQACDKVLECCGVQFSTKASLREHIMIFHHNGYSCPFCGRRFCRKALLRRHLSVHNGQKDYACPSCDYATSHKSNLERHKKIHDRLRVVEGSAIGRGGAEVAEPGGDAARKSPAATKCGLQTTLDKSEILAN